MGLFSWITSAPKRAGEYGKKVVGTEEIKRNADFMVDMAKSLSPKTGRFETFQSAAKRLNLTEEKLQETYAYYNSRFNMFIAFAGLGAVMSVYLFTEGLLSGLAGLAFVLICIAQMFNASFRMYQIRRRELVPVQEWWLNRQEWWVKPFNPAPSTNLPTRSSPRKPK